MLFKTCRYIYPELEIWHDLPTARQLHINLRWIYFNFVIAEEMRDFISWKFLEYLLKNIFNNSCGVRGFETRYNNVYSFFPDAQQGIRIKVVCFLKIL